MRGLFARLVPDPTRYLDLAAILLAAVVVQPMVPLDTWLARDDLVPWTTACMIAVAWSRSTSLGLPPPPALVQRPGGLFASQAALWGPTLVPATLLCWYDTARELTLALVQGEWLGEAAGLFGIAVAFSIGTLVLGRMASSHEVTAWQPPGWPDQAVQLVRGTLVIAGAVGCGVGHAALDTTIDRTGMMGSGLGEVAANSMVWVPISGLLGLQFLGTGLYHDRPQVGRQRRASGRRDRRPYRPTLFRYVLALTGPGLGLALLAFVHAALIGPLTYAHVVVVTIHVLAWASIVWTPPTPVAMSVILHEVVPQGGKDPAPGDQALSFDLPPEGALRLNPLEVRRLRVIHHWLVRVRDPRLENLDDPIRPLWPSAPLPVTHHVLGEASFEPEPYTQAPQWDRITVRLSPQTDIGRLGESTAQQRRMVVLRPFPRDGRWRRAGRTYKWERSIPAASVQVVDATTETLDLRDGDIIVLSTEGVARGYEVEIGSAVYDLAVTLGGQRPAQLEDYVGVS